MNLALQIIDSENWKLQVIWAKVIGELGKHMSEKVMQKYNFEILALTGFSQTEKVRAIGGKILGLLVEKRKKVENDVVRKIFALAQDPSNFVRKNMCRSVKMLYKYAETYRKNAIDELLKLVADECEDVLEKSLKFFIQLFPEAKDKELLLDTIESHYFSPTCDKLTNVKLKYSGSLMRTMSSTMSAPSKDKWVDWVVKMTEEGGLQEKISTSSAFGGILQASGYSTKLLGLWRTLQSSQSQQIEENLAVQLAFFCAHSSQNLPETLNIVKSFLSQPNFVSILTPQMIVISGCIKSYEDCFGYLLSNFHKPQKMRDTVEIIQQLIHFSHKFPCIPQLRTHFPELLRTSKTATEPIRNKFLELLSIIAYKSPGYTTKISLFKEIIVNFAYSKSCYLRTGFIQFCLNIKELCSRKLFNKVFMGHLLALAGDKTLMVQLKFAQNYVAFRYLVPEEYSEQISQFEKILNGYLEQDDKDLIDLALRADRLMNDTREYQIAYGPVAVENEKVKIKMETEEESKEMQEIENVKKRESESIAKSTRKVIRKKCEPQKEPVARQNSVKPVKKFISSEYDRSKISLNRSAVRTVRKK